MLTPPKKIRGALTLASSVRVGVYIGSSSTSCPSAISAVANALSRIQLPQYMPPAPAVMYVIRMGTKGDYSPGVWG